MKSIAPKIASKQNGNQLNNSFQIGFETNNFSTSSIHQVISKLKIGKHQKLFEILFNKFNLNSLDDWIHFPLNKIRLNGGRRLLEKFNNDISPILHQLYPNYPWPSLNLNNKLKITKAKKYFKSMENQRKFMDNLFLNHFQLNNFDEWLNISRKKIIKKGGKILICKYYDYNLNSLLSSVYPNYPFSFDKETSKKEFFYSIENQQKLLDYLFIKFKLKSLDDWINLSRKVTQTRGGKILLEKIYNNNFNLLFSTIYPNFSWQFDSLKTQIIKAKEYFNSIDKQREYIDHLFIKFKLKSLDDWINISRKQIIKNGKLGKRIIEYYNRDLKFLLTSIYPFFPFNFEKLKMITPKKLNTTEKQTKFLDHLFIKLKLNSLDDWYNISKFKLMKNGGTSLLVKYYKNDLPFLLSSIYPNYPWKNHLFKVMKMPKRNLQIRENQQKFMDDLFIKLNFKTFNDWIYIKKHNIIHHGGDQLLSVYYKNNITFLLSSVYPNYPWENFILVKKKFKLIDKLRLMKKLKEWIVKYNITQKKDFYRLPMSVIKSKYDLYATLKNLFPSERWKKSNFHIRNKKTSQRLLFVFTQKIYSTFLIYENYVYPYRNFELDIFIPELQLALEYQGEHHYDDIPSGFSNLELFQGRDEAKEKIAKDNSIKIIYIPYWWDHSLSSLQSSLLSE